MEELFGTFLTLLLAGGLIGFFVMYSTQKRLEKQVEQLMLDKRTNVSVDHDQIIWLADRISEINGTTNADDLKELSSLKELSDENLLLLDWYQGLQKRVSRLETDFYAEEILEKLRREQAEDSDDNDGSEDVILEDKW